MKTALTLLFIAFSVRCVAQGIAGCVLDEKKERAVNVTVEVFSSAGVLAGANVTDYDGNYRVKPLEPGYYKILALYPGYDSVTVTEVIVQPGAITTQNFNLKRSKIDLSRIRKSKGGYRNPLISR